MEENTKKNRRRIYRSFKINELRYKRGSMTYLEDGMLMVEYSIKRLLIEKT